MTENTITYYVIPGTPGHGAVQFGNRDILGKYPFAELRENSVGCNLKDDKDNVLKDNVVVKTVTYPDTEKYNAAAFMRNVSY